MGMKYFVVVEKSKQPDFDKRSDPVYELQGQWSGWATAHAYSVFSVLSKLLGVPHLQDFSAQGRKKWSDCEEGLRSVRAFLGWLRAPENQAPPGEELNSLSDPRWRAELVEELELMQQILEAAAKQGRRFRVDLDT